MNNIKEQIESRRKIHDVIVVEGKNDTVAILRAVEADTIETRGSAVGSDVIAEVKRAQEKRGVIILTDPDGAGERIRRIISQEVPGCKQAFLPQDEARGEKGLGVEHAKPEAIRCALAEARTEDATLSPLISWEAYLEAGLAGGKDSGKIRERLAEALGIGYANGKQFYRRLHLLRITREEFEEALCRAKEEREEPHG
ncbi:RNAse M5 [Marininema mesophilum]|uniref:Ribonuclease M5 n=1 Tax=Marininema mesophilum TaxID=1048340 RepID=A0A1H2WYU4_9BACL|nr:ribonuclease M5 [Marininema mesophilum]SDW85755.1 RNAse M5 [Marininema mesophilum]